MAEQELPKHIESQSDAEPRPPVHDNTHVNEFKLEQFVVLGLLVYNPEVQELPHPPPAQPEPQCWPQPDPHELLLQAL